MALRDTKIDFNFGVTQVYQNNQAIYYDLPTKCRIVTHRILVLSTEVMGICIGGSDEW